jgi:uncharacterized protein (UPF0264 family)
MQLLVSVADGGEAAAALAGGADIIDAKDPTAGPLGPVTIDVLCDISRTVTGQYAPGGAAEPGAARGRAAAATAVRMLSAALGDPDDPDTVERAASAAAAAGARLVKIGFAGVRTRAQAAALLAAATRGAAAASAGRCGVVAVAYADAERVASICPADVVDAAASAGARGILLDTAIKDGPGLPALLPLAALSPWVERAHQRGLLVALAGRLCLEDLELVREAGADIAGVRGAACDGGRAGRISVEKVRGLKSALYQP